jgi:hypothetical protein
VGNEHRIILPVTGLDSSRCQALWQLLSRFELSL